MEIISNYSNCQLRYFFLLPSRSDVFCGWPYAGDSQVLQ
uniref:Uncharacterized protein n=1 Tax=Anguilla anguilla TaxID=7936 RepID=A0A0E9QMJ3_ANGAN